MPRRTLRSLLAAALLAAWSTGAPAAGGAKLPPAEARQWIAALRAMRTDDGSTVAKVLAYAQRMRPAAFKAGGLDIVSMGEPAKPVGVGVDVFIGQKRRAEDAMTLTYEAKLDGRSAVSSRPCIPTLTGPGPRCCGAASLSWPQSTRSTATIASTRAATPSFVETVGYL